MFHLKSSVFTITDTFIHICILQKGHVCGDNMDLINQIPTGSVRVSFGYMSTKEDADQFLKMVENFITKPIIRKTPKDVKISIADIYNRNVEIKQISATVIKLETPEIKNGVKESISTGACDNVCDGKAEGYLEDIFIYPIKSCGSYSVAGNSWELTNTGLKYDRNWMIVDEAGVCLNQKRNRHMCKIRPFIDKEKDEMILNYLGK